VAKTFDTTPEELKYLLASIANREVALPDFQRDFVWEPRATEELIESICRNFPAGSLLRIRNTGGFYFVPREFAGAPALNGHKPAYLILDGQQRLTSLYQAFYGAGAHRYYVDLQGLLDQKDLEDCVFYLRQNEGKKRYGTLKQQAEALVFPLDLLFGSSGGFEDWLDNVLDERPEHGGDRRALKQDLRTLQKTWLQNVQEYQFPMVTLSANTSAEAVCTIFETLNRTGVKLSVFDLLAARFWPKDVRLRDRWKAAWIAHPSLGVWDVDPYYALQIVALLASPRAPSCKRGDVLQMKVEAVEAEWDSAVGGLARAVEILQHQCGVRVPQWLPYNTMLVPGAAALATAANVSGPTVGAVRAKFERWFWCSVFGQTYENAPNAQSMKDFGQLRQWFAGGAPPDSVASFSFDPSVLRDTTFRQRAVYRGIIALTQRNGARDFHTGQTITASLMESAKIDDHHFFPAAYLAGARPDVLPTLRDSVLNRTLIGRQTNLQIGKRAPSDYLTDIRDALGEGTLDQILTSHFIPEGPESPVWTDDFDSFLADRQTRIAAAIDSVTS